MSQSCSVKLRASLKVRVGWRRRSHRRVECVKVVCHYQCQTAVEVLVWRIVTPLCAIQCPSVSVDTVNTVDAYFALIV